jgi:hypothetical protein
MLTRRLAGLVRLELGQGVALAHRCHGADKADLGVNVVGERGAWPNLDWWLHAHRRLSTVTGRSAQRAYNQLEPRHVEASRHSDNHVADL